MSLAEQIAELRGMDVPTLLKRYEAVFSKTPRVRSQVWLWKRLARRLQEEHFGTPAKMRVPRVGTTLVREWKGQQIRVVVHEQGFEYGDSIFTSLSAVAKAITGSHWSGPLFFNLRSRRKAK